MIKIEITTVADLVAFVNIIRGENLDAEEINKLTSIINRDTENLKTAVEGEKDAQSGS